MSITARQRPGLRPPRQQGCDRREAEAFMQCSRGGRAAVGDDGDQSSAVDLLATRDRGRKRAAPAAARPGPVDQILAGRAAGGALALGTGIGIARNRVGSIGHDAGIAASAQDIVAAPLLRERRRLRLDAGRARSDGVTVDRRDGRTIGPGGRTYHVCHGGPLSEVANHRQWHGAISGGHGHRRRATVTLRRDGRLATDPAGSESRWITRRRTSRQ